MNNKINELDVDKWDYMRRDAFYLGAKNVFVDIDLMMKETKIKEYQGQKHLFYNYRYADKVLDVYQSRYKLFKYFYLHKVNHCIELMICDTLYAIENRRETSFLKIMDTCEGIYRMKDLEIEEMTQEQRGEYFQLIENYENFTDDILHRIKLCTSKDQGVLKAQAILKRIDTRDLYKFVVEINLGTQDAAIVKSFTFNVEEAKKEILELEKLKYPSE